MSHLPPNNLVSSGVAFPMTPEKPPIYDLSVHNLTYKVVTRVKKETVEKTLLNNVSVDVHQSELLAIAGPSGSSKTTFLDALAGRINPRSLKGQILVNGKPMDSAFKRVSGYVMQVFDVVLLQHEEEQHAWKEGVERRNPLMSFVSELEKDDALLPNLTTKETLMFSARLRLPGSMKIEEKRLRVDSLIGILGLQACADTRVGNEKVRGVSGGEKRRVSIGVDLIHDPAVLFLDEPTSGLDSTSALHVLQILSQMALNRHRTVVLTIHQPSYRLLASITKFLVLARGNVVYHGDVSGMVGHFSCVQQSMPPHVNVVEFALDVIEELQDQPGGLQRLIEFQRKADPIEENREQLIIEGEPPQATINMNHKPTFANSFISELKVLMQRDMLSILRNKELFFIRVFLAVGVGLTTGTLFLRSGVNRKGVTQRQGFTSFTLAFLIFTSIEALPTFVNERLVFIRESSRGAHRASTFVLSKAAIAIPFYLLIVLAFTATSYFLVGLVLDVHAILYFVLVLFLTLYVADALVAFVASIIPDVAAGQPIVTSLVAFFYLFSGIFILRSAIPKYWIWLHYLSIFKYPYEAIMQNEFGHRNGVIWYDNMDSKRILSSLALGKVHPWVPVIAMSCFAAGYRLLFYLMLRFNTKSLRK